MVDNTQGNTPPRTYADDLLDFAKGVITSNQLKANYADYVKNATAPVAPDLSFIPSALLAKAKASQIP